jgi:hypothetical protein
VSEPSRDVEHHHHHHRVHRLDACDQAGMLEVAALRPGGGSPVSGRSGRQDRQEGLDWGGARRSLPSGRLLRQTPRPPVRSKGRP